MTSTLKRLVSHLNPMASAPKQERIYVAAFGKHPGWDDHIDDIGLTTEALVAFKRRLYLEGICGNIDAGKWVKAEAVNPFIEFGHTFVSVADKTVLMGRLWESTDGKGRSSYPMVVAVQCGMLGLEWILDTLPEFLEKIESACRETRSAELAVEVIAKAQTDLRALAQSSVPAEDLRKSLVIDAEPLPSIADLPEFQTEYGLIRILYFLEREVDRFRTTSGGSSTAQAGSTPKMLRVPFLHDRSKKRLQLWISYLISKYGLSLPVLFIGPSRYAWLDILIGSPTPAQFYCLKASDEAIPLTTRIPYTIEPESIKKYIALMKH